MVQGNDGKEVVVARGAVVEREFETSQVTVESIREQKRVLSLFQQNIPDVLTEHIDYGYVKGIPGKIIRDSGAQNIINVFNAYSGDRKILHLRDDGEIIAIIVEVYIINRKTGNVIATGVGAASTQETRHKYRWIDDPIAWGYTQSDVDKWPKKDIREDKDYETEEISYQYKIKNPEHAELLNIITAQASKRGEVDAVRSLPGAGSALRILLDPELSKYKMRPVDKPDWKMFWAKVSEMGLSQDEVHQKLGVQSINEWLKRGNTLDQALDVLRKTGESPIPAKAATPPGKPRRDPKSVTPDELKSIQVLYKVCNECFGIQPADVIKELGVTSQADITMTPVECWQYIAGARG